MTDMQTLFLAERIAYRSDAAAAEAVGLCYSTIPKWKRTIPEFKAAYDALWLDSIADAKLIAKQNLVAASQTLVDGLAATGRFNAPDWPSRLTAASKLLAIYGITTDRSANETDSVIRVELVDATERRPQLSVGSIEPLEVREIAPADACTGASTGAVD